MYTPTTRTSTMQPLPPLAFATPVSSPSLLLQQRRERAANEPPPLLKRRRTSPPPIGGSAAFFLPMNTNLPFLDFDCNNDYNDLEGKQRAPLSNIKLLPRTKQSRKFCFLSSSLSLSASASASSSSQEPEDQDQDQDQENYEPAPSRKRRIATKNTAAALAIAPSTTTAFAKADNSLREVSCYSTESSSNSSNTTSRRPSVNTMTRSLSRLQFKSISLLNIAALATGSSSCLSSSCPSTTSSMPKRNSLTHTPCSTPPQDEDENNNSNNTGDANANQNNNYRRSSMTTTFDYLAKAMRFPDVAIGLSI